MASMSAVSVFGRIGIHCASKNPGQSDFSGLSTTNSMPVCFGAAQPRFRRVRPGAARRDLCVFQRQAAERDHQPGVLC